jgi:hypothetical protein
MFRFRRSFDFPNVIPPLLAIVIQPLAYNIKQHIITIVIKIGIKIVKSMDFAILISLKDLDFE